MSRRRTIHQLDIRQAKGLLEQVMPIGGGETPTHVLGWREPNGNLRKVQADYPNGWRLTIMIGVRGTITSYHGSIRLTGEVKQ